VAKGSLLKLPIDQHLNQKDKKMKLIISLISMLLLSSISMAAQKKILIVLSAENKILLKEGHSHPTGYFLSELAIPLKKIMAAGYTADFATPSGISPTMDKGSDSVRWFKDAQEYLAIKKLLGSLKQLKNPLALASLNKTQLEKYSAIFLPGGHAPMSDLYRD
jgi:hypothetical protein